VTHPLHTRIIHDPDEAARLLTAGKLVAFPTETVYGLGAVALNADAVAAVFAAKQRPQFDPLIVHLSDTSRLPEVVDSVPETARRLADAFWPGPLTIVLPRSPRVPELVTAGRSTVGIRIPDHPAALALLRAVDRPLAAPSANPFGGVSPTTAWHVLHGLNGRIHAVLDGGPCRVGLESTVVSVAESEPVILRMGGIPVEEIEQVTGKVRIARRNPDLEDGAQPAPGMLSRHYAPRTPLFVIEPDASPVATQPRTGLLTWGSSQPAGFAAVECLSVTGDLRECAANFFAALRSLDSRNLDAIIARRFPEINLGRALNDRLSRAAGWRLETMESRGL